MDASANGNILGVGCGNAVHVYTIVGSTVSHLQSITGVSNEGLQLSDDGETLMVGDNSFGGRIYKKNSITGLYGSHQNISGIDSSHWYGCITGNA